MSERAQRMLADLLNEARLSVPDDVAALADAQGRALGAHSVSVYLVDREQYLLVPLPTPGQDLREPLVIDATLAGRCFRQLELQDSDAGGEVWVPLLNGLERLGVVLVCFPGAEDRASDELLHTFAAMIAELVRVKDSYGDLFARVRQRRAMSLSAQIACNLLPPLTFGTEQVVISCVLAPAYDVGGDSFDYAVDATTARFAVFDAMGHGLDASWLATVAIAAYRNARHEGLDLAGSVDAVDAAISATFAGEQFVTALFAELDLDTGRLRWHAAGHPAPLLLRGMRVVKTLESDPGLPIGLAGTLGEATRIEQEWLEPGDRVLLYTDGVTEARGHDGEFFGVDRLADILTRESAAGHHPAPETMRRLMHAILAHQDHSPRGQRHQDDATAVMVEWRTRGEERITPLNSPLPPPGVVRLTGPDV